MSVPEDIAETFLTVQDVADLLKLNQQTVRNWIDQGSLPALRVGRRVRIRRSDLERVLAAGATRPGMSSSGRASPSAADFWGGEPVGLPDAAAPPEPDFDEASPPGSSDLEDGAAPP